MNSKLKNRTDWIEYVVNVYQFGGSVALLFDYDGTLTPIVHHPSLAVMPMRTHRLLTQLTTFPRIRIGLVSGRSLEDVRTIAGLSNVYYAGSGGMEIDLLGKVERFEAPNTFVTALATIRNRLNDLLKNFPGTWIEPKPCALSIHYRNLLPLSAARFRLEVTEILAEFGEIRFRIVSEAFEVVPADGWDKGMALLSILDHAGRDFNRRLFPVFFGDAPNDLEAMLISALEGGLSVGIGPEAPQVAQFTIANSEDLADQLEVLFLRLKSVLYLDSQSLDVHTNDDCRSEQEVQSEMFGENGLLIIDPNATVRHNVAVGLEKRGWKVFQAETCDQASDLFVEHNDEIQVALVDLSLPGFQGARALAQFGHSNPDLICGFVSEKLSPHTLNTFRNVSDSPLFLKPIDPVELDSILRQMVECNRPEVSLET